VELEIDQKITMYIVDMSNISEINFSMLIVSKNLNNLCKKKVLPPPKKKEMYVINNLKYFSKPHNINYVVHK